MPVPKIINPPALPSQATPLTTTDVRLVFLTDRLSVVNAFTQHLQTINNTSIGTAAQKQITMMMGWILHEGVRSLWKQVYELMHRQMYVTWSLLYDEHENDAEDTEEDEQKLHTVIQYWFDVIKQIIRNVPSNVLKGSAHRHCDIVEPLVAGFFGKQGRRKQKHEAKKGAMYVDNKMEEPNKLNVMVHAKLLRYIDQEMGALKTALLGTKGFGGLL
jgi:hypothetical protein